MSNPDLPSAEVFKKRIETIAEQSRSSVRGLEYADSRSKDRFDSLVRLALKPVVLPLTFLAEAAVMIEDRQLAVVSLERLGVGDETFEQLKIRTMVLSAADLPSHPGKDPNDPRVTRVGKFLRRTSLDELKQFKNVKRREMSVVGPRPIPSHYRALFQESDADVYDEWDPARATMRPGITGPMQTNGRGSLGSTAVGRAKWMELELAYSQSQCVAVDARILIDTVSNVLTAKDAY